MSVAFLSYDYFIEKNIEKDVDMKVSINQANLKNDHIYLNSMISVFPTDCIGGTNSKNKGTELKISYKCGSGTKSFMSDIAGDKNILRKRGKQSGTGMLLADLDAKDGDILDFRMVDVYHFEVVKVS